jgi:large subunit ribosomal protein L6
MGMDIMFFKETIVAEGVNIEVSGNRVKAVGPKGTIEKSFIISKDMKIEKAENKVKVSSESDDRSTKALVGTIAAHIRNMVSGVTKGCTYRLRVIYSHFPVTIKVDKDKVLIQNFLGERTPRIARIIGKTEIKIEGSDLVLNGIDIDEVSQTAGNIEQAARIVGYDKKVFQDGIYIVAKGE